jgi:hypothetical protein
MLLTDLLPNFPNRIMSEVCTFVLFGVFSNSKRRPPCDRLLGPKAHRAHGATTPPAPSVGPLAAATPSSLAFPDKLPLPLLSRHRLSADLLALLYLQAVDEHAEVLADRNQRPMLVVHLHAQRAIGAL